MPETNQDIPPLTSHQRNGDTIVSQLLTKSFLLLHGPDWDGPNTPNRVNLLDYSRNRPPGRVGAPLLPPRPSHIQIIRHQRFPSKISQPTNTLQSSSSYNKSMSINKIAPLTIRFLIVGGGIAGLAAAFALGQSGHCVHVLEKSPKLRQRSGGIRVPPNLSKILFEWGLEKELSKAKRCRKTVFHSVDTGEYMGFLEWQADVIRETGGEFLLMAHDELHQMLYKLALSVGARVSFNTVITSVIVDEARGCPSVTLEDGSTLEADVVIGADGYQSFIRAFVNGVQDDAVETGHSFLTINIPSEKLKKDPDLGKWADLPEWPVWMGDMRSVLAYPIRNGEEYCFHFYWPDAELQDGASMEEGWDKIVSTNCLNLEGYDEGLRRLLKLVPDALRTKCMKRDLVEDWVDETGRVVLIGEAAHPILPCSTHGASLAVEDAVVLGVLMSRLRTSEQIPQLLEAFQDIRQGRCAHVRISELHNATLVTLPPGEDRDMRDAAMRLSLNINPDADWDDTKLRTQWEEIGEVFGYNAGEAAEDWWLKWGVLGDATEKTPADLFSCFEVTKVETSLFETPLTNCT